MEQILSGNYHQMFKKRWTILVLITLIFVILSLILTLAQPFRYVSQVKILVIQRSAVAIDAYSASKSAERIGGNLAQVIYSSSFFNKVLNSGFDIDNSYFPKEEDKRREVWRRMIDSKVPTGTTLLDVSVYHPQREQATIIAQAIAYVLPRDLVEYIGISDVELKVLDAPLTSEHPVKPNFVLNLFLGLLVGIFVAISYLIVTYSDSPESLYFEENPGKMSWKQRRAHKKARQEQKKQSSGVIKSTVSSASAEPVMPDVSEVFKKQDQEPVSPTTQRYEHFSPEIDLTDDADEAEVVEEEELAENLVKPELASVKNEWPEFEEEDEIKTLYDK